MLIVISPNHFLIKPFTFQDDTSAILGSQENLLFDGMADSEVERRIKAGLSSVSLLAVSWLSSVMNSIFVEEACYSAYYYTSDMQFRFKTLKFICFLARSKFIWRDSG